MHGSHQAVQPSKILPFIVPHMPAGHECLLWLTDGEFRNPGGDKSSPPSSVELRDQHGIKAGNSTARRKYEYWVEGKREVEPLHGPLQRRFVEFLAGREIDCVQDESYVDIRYQQDGVEVLVEVTPTANVDTRYAIRAAVGSTSNTG